MTLFWRRLLTILLFFVLAIVGPILLAYGAGYRLNLKEKRIERAGLLHVTTDPENATMVLDGVSYDTSDELVITGLLPGEYEISINKDGYHDWIKKLQIVGGQTTFIRDLQLIKNQPAELIHELAENETLVLATQTELYTQQSNVLIKTTLANSERTEFPLTSDFPLAFAQDAGDEILFSQNAIWYMTQNDVLQIQDFGIENIINKAVLSGRDLYYTTTTGLSRLATNTNSSIQIVAQNQITDFLVTDNGYWILATEPARKNAFLFYLESESENPELITTLPYNQGLSIRDEYRNFLTLENPGENELILIDNTQSPATTETIKDVSAWQWSTDHEQLLVATTFELTILHFNDQGRQEVLLRQTTPFIDAAWDTQEQHVLFISGNAIKMVERDERNQRNIYTLAENLKTPELLLLTDDSEQLYFVTDNDQKIWQRELR